MTSPAPLSVIIPTRNAAQGLPHCLAALVPGVADGLIKEVIIADCGSTDGTREIADGAGALVVDGPEGRGAQLAAGARSARGRWLLFLHGDTVLEPGWVWESRAFINGAVDRAAAFRFALDDDSGPARRMAAMVAWRCRLLGLPYGDQGLLISRGFYDSLGGFRAYPLMEDVDLVRRIGKRRLTLLRSAAVTSAVRYRQDGYVLRPLRNLMLLSLFFLRVPPRVLARLYD